MQVFPRVLLVALFSMAMAYCASGTENISVDQAVEILKSSKPVENAWEALSLADPVQLEAAEDRYNQQIEAIDALGNAKAPSTAALLIPYLNFSSRELAPRIYDGSEEPEDINETRYGWPAFGALLEIPKASDVLSAYALDRKNPLSFRVAAFTVLKYRNQRQFETVGKTLSDELKVFPSAEKYIQEIQSGKVPFHGVVEIDTSLSLSVDQAVEILKTTSPMQDPQMQMGSTDPIKKKFAEDLYNRQIGAIQQLGNNKVSAAAALMIPYLGYPEKDVYTGGATHLSPEGPPPENIHETRRDWPAFAALLEIPHAADALSSYCLDKNNPTSLRIASFTVLRYLHQQQFKTVGSALSAELKSFPLIVKYINEVQSGKIPFHGVVDFNSEVID